MPSNESDVVAALQRGDEAALSALMDRYELPVHSFIYRHVYDREDANELTQEVFVRVFFSAKKYRPTGKFSTWLFQIALNLCRDHAKSRRSKERGRTENMERDSKVGGSGLDRFASDEVSPSAAASSSEEIRGIEEALQSLPIGLRTAIVLTALEGKSHHEAAEILEVTPKAVETRVYRARKLLKEALSRRVG